MSHLSHAALTGWSVIDDFLMIGGKTVAELAECVGRTPFFVYDSKQIEHRVELLRHHIPNDVKLYYALKANPMPDLVRFVADVVDGFDVASVGEMELALQAGFLRERVSFAGPGKTAAELASATHAGILISIESLREVAVLSEIREQSGAAARVAIRVNPPFEIKSSGLKMGGGAAAFGVDSEKVSGVLAAIGEARLQFEGFHIFSGSQSLNTDAICRSHSQAVATILDLAHDAPAPVRSVNIGGGLGIPYFPGEQPLDIARVGDNLRTLSGMIKERFSEASLVIELGRFIVGEAGLYVCRVIDRKISRGRVFLVTDGGMHHHLAASGHFGQVVRRNYPVVLGNRMSSRPTETASIVGPLCTPLDVLADRVELPEGQEGDLVVVFQSGAYGLTASPTAFLSHPKPAELLV